ncbi:MAG: hypothetical protein KF831_10625 [Acidobacteria bacterium]|nr:hypothetical protein [Acidobacteriota bacterium]
MKQLTSEKYVWTEEDFGQMGWHDNTLYAIAILPDKYQLMLDIDYIFRWIDPLESGSFFTFLLSPSTLIFENVHGLSIDISEPFRPIQIQSIERFNPKPPPNADQIIRNTEWEWTIDLEVGVIRFESVGYKQYTRETPAIFSSQSIDFEKRGGISFSTSTPL